MTALYLKERVVLNNKFSGRTVTAIVMFPNKKILLVKRGTKIFKGYWALPGGRVNTGETIEQAVVREVIEETGIHDRIVRKIGEYHETGIKDEIEYNYHAACFLAKPTGGKIKGQEKEIEDVKLVDLKDIPERLAFKHSSMIKNYISTLNEN